MRSMLIAVTISLGIAVGAAASYHKPAIAQVSQFTPAACKEPRHSVNTIGTTAATCTPVAGLDGRRYIGICNSPLNAGAPNIRIRIDNVPPVNPSTVASAGDVVTKGNCVGYYLGSYIGAGTLPKCIADTAGTVINILECK